MDLRDSQVRLTDASETREQRKKDGEENERGPLGNNCDGLSNALPSLPPRIQELHSSKIPHCSEDSRNQLVE